MSQIDLKQLKVPADQAEVDIYEDIRADLEDSLKEYSELDLLVELIQNALDAMDERRYIQLCNALSVDPQEASTIKAWNSTVDDLIKSDYESFPHSEGASVRAVWQAGSIDERSRRKRWAEVLVENLALEETAVDIILGEDFSWAQLGIELDLAGPNRVRITDSGVGMGSLLPSFRHKGSTKRRQETRRRGTRGSHGWGLSAILGLCDRVDVVSKTQKGESQGLRMESFASFRSDPSVQPSITAFGAEELEVAGFDHIAGDSGTSVQVTLPHLYAGGLLQRLVDEGTADQWAASLRLYTPIGQVNDYVLHPAYHCLRRSDLRVQLRLKRGADDQIRVVPYDYLRLNDLKPELCVSLKAFVDGGMPPGKSVYCVGREQAGANYYLVAAEIQASKPTMASIESSSPQLMSYETESGDPAPVIPRGIFLSLSGGMRSESVALPALSTNAAFRGVVLAETARATLGRRHTMDQRTAIPNAAKSYARTNDDVRKKTIPSGQAVLTGPALNKWQRNLWKKVKEELTQDPPFADIKTWAAAGSGEARVMLAYAELLGQRAFGNVRVLRCSLQDVYDFQFVYRWTPGEVSGPTPSHSETLRQQGFADKDAAGEYRRLAIGEFKAQGDSLLREFDDTGKDWRKNPNSIDLLVCWDFDESVLGESWTSAEVSANTETREFHGQTHVWTPSPGNARTRPLAVLSVAHLLGLLIEDGQLEAFEEWETVVGSNYYDE